MLGRRMGKLEKEAWPSLGSGWQLCPACELLSAALDPQAVFQTSRGITGFTKHEPESEKEKRVNGSADLTSSCLCLEECVALLVLACL